MKINIFSVHAGRTDFLQKQYESISFFLKEKFEYFCIDNFYNESDSSFIKRKCEELGINHVKFDNYTLKGNAFDHAPALNSIKNITSNDDINIIVDFDVFMIGDFSVLNYIGDYDIAGLYQQRNNFELEYLAPFLVIVNHNREFSSIDFNSHSNILSDVGGNTSEYLKNKSVRLVKHTSALNKDKDKDCFLIDYNPSYGCQILEGSFLHYYRGSNWDNSSPTYHQEKTEWLDLILDKSKKEKVLNYEYLDLYQNVFNHSFNYWNGSGENFNTILNPYLEK